MNIYDAVALGLVQGLTEFLPVSSSGHLVITETLLGLSIPGILVEVTLHVGTLLSVIIVYRARIWSLIEGALHGQADAWRYIGLLVLATIPAGLVGVLFQSSVESAFDDPAIAGAMLLVTGVILWSTRRTRRPRTRPLPGPLLALGIGVAQAFAILPGISRSGSTIAAALWGGVDGEKAAEFSFLMSVPAIAGAAVLELKDVDVGVQGVGGVPLLVGFLVALVAGIFAIRFLVWLLRGQRFHVFAYYVWVVGAAFLAYLAIR